MHRTLLVLALLASNAAVSDTPVPTWTENGQTMTRMFYGDMITELWLAMNEEMRSALGSEFRLQQFRDQVGASLGAETSVISERVTEFSGYMVYVRVARFEHSPTPIVVTFSFDPGGKIGGFSIQPQREPADSPYLEYETKSNLRLPFDGEWFVFWGGRTVEENYHAIVADQRFAYDFLIVRNGRSYEGDGTSLEDYHCWGEPILAPAAGTVVQTVTGHVDMAPGEMDPSNPAGNHVILDLGNDEYALFAHFMHESIVVSAGDEVSPGDQLGQCGNSGNTSEPHLHFHLQDAPSFGEGDGKPAFFNSYLANGEPVERGEPRRGEMVSPAN